jgi:peroxiredoxin
MLKRCHFTLMISSVLLLTIELRPAPAEETSAPVSFAVLHRNHRRMEFERVKEWFLAQPKPHSADALDALDWLLDTGFQTGWYAHLSPLVEDEELPLSPLGKKIARMRILSRAAQGHAEQAVSDYVDHLKTIRLRSPNETLELTSALSSQLQINGDYDAAREVLRRTTDAFFLNEQVRTLLERRLAKLLLAEHPAPRLQAGDHSLADLKGRYVLLDFWATSCAPCIVDLPNLKSVARRFSQDEFTIVGVSLDASTDAVEQFKERFRFDWPTPLVENCEPAPRESYRVITIPSTFLIDPEGKVVLVDGSARDVGLLLEKKLATGD